MDKLDRLIREDVKAHYHRKTSTFSPLKLLTIIFLLLFLSASFFIMLNDESSIVAYVVNNINGDSYCFFEGNRLLSTKIRCNMVSYQNSEVAFELTNYMDTSIILQKVTTDLCSISINKTLPMHDTEIVFMNCPGMERSNEFSLNIIDKSSGISHTLHGKMVI